MKKQAPPRGVKNNNNVFIKRNVQVTTFGTTVATGWNAIPLTFSANSLPGWSGLQDNFDTYRINAVKLTLTPFWDTADVNQNGPAYNTLPRVYTQIDRNGFPAGSLATEARFLESAKTYQVMEPGKGFTIFIKNPAVEGSVAIGGGFTANAQTTWSPWLDTSNGNVEHNGAAMGIVLPAGSPGSGWYYNINATYYLQMRHSV